MLNTFILLFSYLAVLLYPLGQLGRISFSNQQVNLYPYELVMSLTLLTLFFKYRFSVFKNIRKNRLFLAIFLFFATLLISYFFSFKSFNNWANFVGLLYFLRLCAYFLYFIFTILHIHHHKELKAHIKSQILFLVFVILITSVLQYVFYPNLRNLLYQGWDPHLYRVFSFFFEPYLAGAGITLSLFFTYFHFNSKIKFFKYGILTVLFILLMLTFSRTVYLASMGTIIFYFMRKGNLKIITLIIALFVLLVLVIPKPVGVGVQLYRTFSIDTRLQNALEGVRLWSKSPILGIGYDRIRYRKEQLHLVDSASLTHAASGYHSSFVIMLVAGGIFGLCGMLGILWMLGRISTPSLFYVLFLSLLSFGDNALLHPFILFMLFLFLSFEVNYRVNS